MKDKDIVYNDYILKFRKLIKDLGLNNSSQKEYILKLLFDSKKHLSADEISLLVKQNYNINIGIATVYRILNLFEEINIVNFISIKGNCSKVYELNLKSHHDHIVCLRCGDIVEFMDEEIESIQESIAKENGFVLKNHNMIMYGICKKCQ